MPSRLCIDTPCQNLTFAFHTRSVVLNSPAASITSISAQEGEKNSLYCIVYCIVVQVMNALFDSLPPKNKIGIKITTLPENEMEYFISLSHFFPICLLKPSNDLKYTQLQNYQCQDSEPVVRIRFELVSSMYFVLCTYWISYFAIPTGLSSTVAIQAQRGATVTPCLEASKNHT